MDDGIDVNYILEMYKNLSDREKIRFDREYNRIKIEEKNEIQKAKNELKNTFKNLVDDDGNPYISDEWLEKYL